MMCANLEFGGALIDIGNWLRTLGLERYEAAFRENEINERVLPRLTAEDLKDPHPRHTRLRTLTKLPFLQPRIQQGWRTEWSEDLNQIAMEEISHGYPDITYILHRSDPKYPSQILFRDAHNPDPTQLAALHSGIAEIIKLYCPPNTKDPYP
jgi:hypothetical protein